MATGSSTTRPPGRNQVGSAGAALPGCLRGASLRANRARPAHGLGLAALFGLAALVTLVGCPSGEGEGRVVGRFYVLGCDDAYSFGSPETPAFYDMGANFFVGEPILDDTAVSPRHRLDLRLQKGGNNLEGGDSLYIQVWDVAAAAQQFSLGQGSPVGKGQAVRASLLLYVTCPTFYGSLTAAPRMDLEACPTLDATDTEARCATLDFNAPLDPDTDFAPLVTGHSCIVFCRLGSARRGQEVPQGFAVDFGDEVQGFFQINLTDSRLMEAGVEICGDGVDNDGDGEVDEEDCEVSPGMGTLRGSFNFEVRRGQVAQEFP